MTIEGVVDEGRINQFIEDLGQCSGSLYEKWYVIFRWQGAWWGWLFSQGRKSNQNTNKCKHSHHEINQ